MIEGIILILIRNSFGLEYSLVVLDLLRVVERDVDLQLLLFLAEHENERGL